MARRIKLGELLNAAFKIPDTGVVNIRLLFEILRALLHKLDLTDLDVVVDLDPLDSTHLATETLDVSAIDEVHRPGLEDSDSNTIVDGNTKEHIKQILSQSKAFMVRLQALESGLADLRAKRAEDLETMAKMLSQIDQLDARLCEQEKMVARLEKDMDCLAMAMVDYDIKIEDMLRRLDLMGVEIREIRCQMRCIEKERQQFLANVQTITEQVNHLSVTKADKDTMERELSLRALVKDLERYVPCECFKMAQLELSSNIAKLYEKIYRQEESLKTTSYELSKKLQLKADLESTHDLRRQQAKILAKFKEMEKDSQLRSTTAAGIALNTKRSGHCITCGLKASLDGCTELIPRPVQFISCSRAKSMFTLQSRYCGGDYTSTRPQEKLVQQAQVLGLECVAKNFPLPKQIVGDDGVLYLADSCPEQLLL